MLISVINNKFRTFHNHVNYFFYLHNNSKVEHNSMYKLNDYSENVRSNTHTTIADTLIHELQMCVLSISELTLSQ